MQITRTIDAFRAALAPLRAKGTVALVPTMGALHAGHLDLVARAKAAHPIVAATIFVNPSQFGDPSDLEKYPRTEAADLAALKGAGVDVVFLPSADQIYPENDETVVETRRLANMLHGLVRPGHFRGVTTVVARLFNIAAPDAAYFGEKDYQQLAVIKRMVTDLHFPIDIIGVPTVREDDGLAMSSRNMRLTTEDRAAAPVLARSLDAAQVACALGADVTALRKLITDMINAEPLADLASVDVVWADSFEPASGPVERPIGVMVSARFGDILLIDQREMAAPRRV